MPRYMSDNLDENPTRASAAILSDDRTHGDDGATSIYPMSQFSGDR